MSTRMRTDRSSSSSVPVALVDAADWTWRVLLLLGAGWVLLQLAKELYLLVLPFAAGVLLTALANPLVALLRRWGAPRSLAVLLTGLGFVAAVGGAGYWVVVRAVRQAPALATGAADVLDELPISNAQLASLRDRANSALLERASTLAGPLVSGLATAGEFATGIIIAIFVALYLLYRGEEVWGWVVSLAPRAQRPAMQRVGPAMWRALAGWVRGTAVIAAIHGAIVGITLTIMGVPLAASLAVLVFLGAFVPIVGGVAAGTFAVLVTLATHGIVPAAVLVGVLIIDSQIEAHVLQPFLVGRYVELNALAVVAALTAGGLLWGVAGAILAVPLTAAWHAALVAHARGGASALVAPDAPDRPARPDGPDPGPGPGPVPGT